MAMHLLLFTRSQSFIPETDREKPKIKTKQNAFVQKGTHIPGRIHW